MENKKCTARFDLNKHFGVHIYFILFLMKPFFSSFSCTFLRSASLVFSCVSTGIPNTTYLDDGDTNNAQKKKKKPTEGEQAGGEP